MKIGFIGLGIMGKPMVRNLLKAGYPVMVWNRSQKAVEEAAAWGAVPAARERLGREADIVMTMLPDSPQVKEVMLGSEGVARYMHAGQIFVDCSSINPVASKRIYDVLREKGIEMLDAPVSGGEPKAIDGTLSFMVGGKQAVFDACKEVLLAMGASVVRCGDVGAGNTTKLANQIIVACNIQALSEALTLAQKAGVDPELVVQAIRGGLAGSMVLNAKAPMMLEGNDEPGFKIDLHIKDLNNALDCAHSVGSPAPMTAQVQEVMQWLHNHGAGQKDHSAIAQYYEYLTGIQIGR